MKRHSTLAALLLAATACRAQVGPEGPWVPWDEVEGALRPEVVAAAPAPPAPAPVVRLVTFNVHYGNDSEALARAFRENAALAGADIVLLQETRSFPWEGESRPRKLAAALGMAHAYAPSREVDGGTHGLAVLSRYPLENVAVMELPRIDLVVASEHRIALAADVVLGERLLRVINVHLDTRINVPERILQLRPAVIDAPPLTIVGGDFNSNLFTWAAGLVPGVPAQAAGSSDQAPALDAYFEALGFQNPTAPLGPTAPFPLLELRMDALHTRGLESGDGAVERSVDISDHWPVWLDVRI